MFGQQVDGEGGGGRWGAGAVPQTRTGQLARRIHSMPAWLWPASCRAARPATVRSGLWKRRALRLCVSRAEATAPTCRTEARAAPGRPNLITRDRAPVRVCVADDCADGRLAQAQALREQQDVRPPGRGDPDQRDRRQPQVPGLKGAGRMEIQSAASTCIHIPVWRQNVSLGSEAWAQWHEE
jgi:hypothetical protein